MTRSAVWIRSVSGLTIAMAFASATAMAQVLPPSASHLPPLRVVTLFTVLTEIATDVGGPDVEVRGLLPPGVDPHTFEPAPDAIRALADADLVLASGLGLESYLDKLAANSGTRGAILSVGDGLREPVRDAPEVGSPSSPPAERRGGDGRAGARPFDPHWWNSIAAARQATREVEAAMAARRPGAEGGFRARADALVARLDALDAWTRAQLAVLAPDRRQLVTTHDAFGWFARDYGFTVHPISGLSPEADPNARDFARLADLIRSRHIPAVFIEHAENSKLAAALAREAGVRLGGTLYPDGLVPEADGATYEAMFRHNVLTIVAALR